MLDAAFSDDLAAMQTYLPKLMDNLAVNAAPTIPGRLNINQAPRPLLRAFPGLDPNVVEQIIADRDVKSARSGPSRPTKRGC